MRAKAQAAIFATVVVVLMATTTGDTLANSPPLAGVSLESDPYFQSLFQWAVTVRNDAILGRPGNDLWNVKVKITPKSLPGALVQSETDGHFDGSTGIWTIPIIPSGSSAVGVFVVGKFSRDDAELHGNDVALRLRAEIVEIGSLGMSSFQFNNAIDAWYLFEGNDARVNFGDAGAGPFVSSTTPSGEQVTFGVRAVNDFTQDPSIISSNQDHRQYAVQMRIDLSPGLRFMRGQADAAGVTFINDTTANWDVGTVLHSHGRSECSLSSSPPTPH